MFKILITIIVVIICILSNVQGSSDGMYAAFNAEPSVAEPSVAEPSVAELPSQSTILITAEDWFDKGVDLYSQGKYYEAAQAFGNATKINPQYEEAWINKGYMLYLLDKERAAITAYDKAIEINPKNAFVWNNKGLALGSLGKPEEAIKAFDEAISLDPDFAWPWNNKGLVLYLMATERDLCIILNTTLPGGPPEIVYDCRINSSRLNDSIEAFDKAIELDPTYPMPWHQKGTALLKLGKTKEANVAFTKAKELGYDG